MENGVSASLTLIGGQRCSQCLIPQSSLLSHLVDVKVSNTTGDPYFVAQRCSPSIAAIAYHSSCQPASPDLLWSAHQRWRIALFLPSVENGTEATVEKRATRATATQVASGCRTDHPSREPVLIPCLKTSLCRGDDRPRSLSTLYTSCRGKPVQCQVSVRIFPCDSSIFQ